MIKKTEYADKYVFREQGVTVAARHSEIIINMRTISILISFPRPSVSCPFYSLLGNYQITGMCRSMSRVLGVHEYYQEIRLIFS